VLSVDFFWVKNAFSDNLEPFGGYLPVKAASIAFMARGIAHLLDFEKDGVAVAIYEHGLHLLDIAAFLSLPP
jgi:hypothetical protein